MKYVFPVAANVAVVLRVVDNVRSCVAYQQAAHQRQYCQRSLNAGGYGSSPQLQQQSQQTRTFAAQSQYYGSPGPHKQMMRAALADFNSQAHRKQQHSPIHSQYQQPAAVSAANEYSSCWQQPVSSVNVAGDRTSKSVTQYCNFADPCQDVMSNNQQRLDHSMRSQQPQQLNNGFGTAGSMQCGFIGGGQQLPPGADVSQNHCVAQNAETSLLAVNKPGASRQQMLQYDVYQQPDMIANHQQTGRRPRHFIVPGQHSVNSNSQPMMTCDAFTGYHDPSMIQPQQSFAIQQQQQPRTSTQSYTQTGCYAFLTAHHSSLTIAGCFNFIQTTSFTLRASIRIELFALRVVGYGGELCI